MSSGGAACRPGELVSVPDIAEMLGVHPSTPWQWAARGLLPAPWGAWGGGRQKLWRREDIAAWALATGRVPAES